jgi:uncharacterized protein
VRLALIVRVLVLGALFGFILLKSQVVSWYRMQEMFHFQSFYMYGIFVSAIATAALTVAMLRRLHVRAADGSALSLERFQPPLTRYALGGLIFGVGWALTGICPGPIAALIGAGYSVVIAVLASAMLGTWTYLGLARRLPQ